MCEEIINFVQPPISQQDLSALLGDEDVSRPPKLTVSRAAVEEFVEYFCRSSAKHGLEPKPEDVRKWIEDKLWCSNTTIVEEVEL